MLTPPPPPTARPRSGAAVRAAVQPWQGRAKRRGAERWGGGREGRGETLSKKSAVQTAPAPPGQGTAHRSASRSPARPAPHGVIYLCRHSPTITATFSPFFFFFFFFLTEEIPPPLPPLLRLSGAVAILPALRIQQRGPQPSVCLHPPLVPPIKRCDPGGAALCPPPIIPGGIRPPKLRAVPCGGGTAGRASVPQFPYVCVWGVGGDDGGPPTCTKRNPSPHTPH